MSKDIILTGVKPTGRLHLGNLVGAVRPILDMSKKSQTFVFVADLHALNAVHDPKILREYVIEEAATFLALGLNPKDTIFFCQSDLPQVSELSTLLMNITPKGLMNRAHSYKAMMDKNAAEGLDTDAGVNMGLYTYPVLMSADILLYGADVVPVGKDQKQHLEFARDIAGYFNNTYGETFKLPKPFIPEETGIIPGLDGRKMSKSYNNQIAIFDTESELKKKIMKIVTDSKLPNESKNPDESAIFLLYRHFADKAAIKEMRDNFINGEIGYGDAKKLLFDAVNDYLAEPRKEYERLMKHPEEISEILKSGAERAREVASETIVRVKKAMGLNYFE